MHKKIFGIFVCILFFGSILFPSIIGYDKDIDGYQILIKQAIKYGVISNIDWVEQHKQRSPDQANVFGWSVSIDGDTALIGAPYDSDNGERAGAAYIFKWSGINWQWRAKLLPSDGTEYHFFGHSVSIDGDYAIIGAISDDDNGGRAGAAYIFKYSGTSWTQQAKLLASDGAHADLFGYSVSISGDYALIGAWGDDDNGEESGSAYIFKRDGTSWYQEEKLLASDGESSDNFGWSVSIDGEFAIIGANLDDDNGEMAGSTYVFKRSGTSWVQQAKLLASDGAEWDKFGESVSIMGDYVIVGAPEDNGKGYNFGSAYIFKRSETSWVQQAKLLASDGVNGMYFGYSVSISGDLVLIGAWGDDDNGETSGSAYVFKRSGTSWVQQAKLLASDGAESDRFGHSVSISGDYALMGVPMDDWGSIYIFRKNQPPDIPTIKGEISGIAGTEYGYIFNVTDPNGDNVKYFIEWGDNNTEWTDFYASGTDVIVNHTWNKKGTYYIRAKAQDIYYAEGLKGLLTVNMPRNKLLYYCFNLISWFFERVPILEVFLREMNLLR